MQQNKQKKTKETNQTVGSSKPSTNTPKYTPHLKTFAETAYVTILDQKLIAK